MSLTATITWAADSWLEMQVEQIPELVVHASSLREARKAVREEAAKLTNRPPEEFHVELRF